MKKLVTAALTAVTAVIAGSAIALTPVYSQEVPPGEETPTPVVTATPSSAPQSTQQAAPGTQTATPVATGTTQPSNQATTPQSTPSSTSARATPATNVVIFVVPSGAGEISDAACSLDEVAESSQVTSAMRFDHTREHTSDRFRESSERDEGNEVESEADAGDSMSGDSDDVGLPGEACNTLQGLFASLAGLIARSTTTDAGTDTSVDNDEGNAGDDEAMTEDEDEATDDDEATTEDETDGAATGTNAATLTPVAGRTALYVTIFAGDDAGEDGCTLGDLIAAAGGSVPVVEAGGEVPLQGAADISNIALPADACAMLAAFLGAMAGAPARPAGQSAPAVDGTSVPSTTTDADDQDEAADEEDEATAEDEDDPTSTPSASRSRGTSTPTAGAGSTGAADSSDEEEEDEPAATGTPTAMPPR